LIGTPDEIIDMIRDREAMGLTEIALLPSMEFARRNLADFSKYIIDRY
jgi:alkanesulfonate monooxygenase SsuD/methylene tetrahydromethanopterin reductase-like flavin-dependent oxidoreductase (luciferase family)